MPGKREEMEEAIMTNGPDEPPWSQPTAEEHAEYARREAAADHRYHHIPARDPAERAEYDRQEAVDAAADEAEERFIHFHGRHVQDPAVPHGNCVDYCPYDTPEQARERAERRAWAEAMEAGYAAEHEGADMAGPEDNPGSWAETDPEDAAAYENLDAALRAEEAAWRRARAAGEERQEALIAQQEAPWPSQAHEEASARVVRVGAEHHAARAAYQAARLAAISMAAAVRAHEAAPNAEAGSDDGAGSEPDVTAQRPAASASGLRQMPEARRRRQYGEPPADQGRPHNRRPPAEPGHDGPVPRM